ncbi:MAG: radical SAM protein [Candidatus Omnitrophota bacterium]
MDEFKVDAHKLIYHVDRVSQWLKGQVIYPLYIEIAPSGGCNHRCIFCALDYLQYQPAYLSTDILKTFLKDIAQKGVQSIMFAGEGEPLLHKDIAGLIGYSKEQGLDIAVTTNGVLLAKKLSAEILPHLSWLRISLNAGTAKTYASIHNTAEKDFEKVINNIEEALAIKKQIGSSCTIGAQFLLLNENYQEAEGLAQKLKGIGVDYLIIKPYSQHPHSLNQLRSALDYEKLLFLEEMLNKYNSEKFNIIFRKKTMVKTKRKKIYTQCLGLPFWTYLSSQGDLYACSSFLGDARFLYGNIYQTSFTEAWNSQQRERISELMRHNWDIEQCRQVCRMDEINHYLWELKNPPAHVNFI